MVTIKWGAVSNHEDQNVFDRLRAIALAEAKKTFLSKFLPELIKREDFNTALDAGCGFGYFSGYLRDLGLEVSAFDVRPENIKEAKKRNPEVKFIVCDIKNPSIEHLGQYDLVLCFGLLYHLENPFRAIRNLFILTKKISIIETMISPYKSEIAVLRKEEGGEDQSLNYVSLIPSESCFIKMLYEAGFPKVYRCSFSPEFEEFHSSILFKRRRTVLVASKIELPETMFHLVQRPRRTNRYLWLRFGLGRVLENKPLRKALKSMVRFLHVILRRVIRVDKCFGEFFKK